MPHSQAVDRPHAAPLGNYYAEKILASSSIRKGICLDVGCGGGYLGMALASMTDLDFIFMDPSPAMLLMTRRNLEARSMAHRSRTLLAPSQAIPMADESVDLVISRGSVPVWENLPASIREFQRILRPGGQGYIWGGTPPRETQRERDDRLRQWAPQRRRRPSRHPDAIAASLWEAGFRRFEVIHDEVGTWIHFTRD